jgi:hypothetical protein
LEWPWTSVRAKCIGLIMGKAKSNEQTLTALGLKMS